MTAIGTTLPSTKAEFSALRPLFFPIEAIAELHVISNFEAEYGRSAGGVINIVTKSGTNTIHGSVFDYFRNNALDARNFFRSSQQQNPFHDNQFGAALGGPIIKDKTFFFVDYEAVRETGAESSTACVPTAGDIADSTRGAECQSCDRNLLALNRAGRSQIRQGPVLVIQQKSTVPYNTVLSTPFSNRVDSAHRENRSQF